MIMCEQVVIFTLREPNPINITIDLPKSTPRHQIEEFLLSAYSNLLPNEGWVSRAHLGFLGETCLLELIDKVWLLRKPQQEN